MLRKLDETTVNGPDGSSVPAPRPGLYYGWVMLPVAVAGVIATSPGQTYAIAAFNPSFRADLGLSHTQLTGAYMLGTLLAALPLALVGRMMDRHGLRKALVVTVCLLGGACLVAAAATGPVTVFLAFFLLRMLGPGALSLLSSSTLAFWFDRRLGTVEGIRQVGMAAALAAVPALNLWLIGAVGWRAAFVVLGLAVCGVMLPLLLFVFHNRPEDVGQVIDGKAGEVAPVPAGPEMTLREATRTRSFWIVLGLNALWALVGTGVTFNVVPIAVSQGLTDRDAAVLLTVFAAAMAVTHLVGGVLADRVALHRLLAASAVCMAGSALLMRSLAVPGTVVGCGVLMGVAQGLSGGITSVVCVRYWGRLHLGQIRGAFSTVVVAASSAGPFLIGLTYDLTGGYGGILTAFAAAGLVAAVAAAFAPRPTHSPAVAFSIGPTTPDQTPPHPVRRLTERGAAAAAQRRRNE